MTNIKKHKYSAVYVRVSTEDQKEGLSPEVQKKLCTKKAEDEGYKVLEVLDDSGLSGYKVNRDGLVRIKELIEEGKIQAVVALSSDRLFRNAKEHMAFRELVFARGIQMLYVHQATPENNATGNFQDGMQALVNQFYRDQISDKVKISLTAKAEAGYFPTVPSPGYVNAEDPLAIDKLSKRIIVPDPVMAPLIKELFQLYASGVYSVYDLTEMMNSRGLRSHKGFPLSASRVYDLLRNRIYLGEVSWGTVKGVKGKHEPLVDEATFNQVQVVLATHNKKASRRRKHSWLLSGFLYCANHLKRYVAEWH